MSETNKHNAVLSRKRYKFDVTEMNLKLKIKETLKLLNVCGKEPVFVCVGSDLVVGDCLGPLIGTMLKNMRLPYNVYGTLSFPITAKGINAVGRYLDKAHKGSFVVAIDASVGHYKDIGKIVVSSDGLKPGLGVNKKLDNLGNASIAAVVAEKTSTNAKLFSMTRLNLIYNMATAIAEGISAYASYYKDKRNGINIFRQEYRSVNI